MQLTPFDIGRVETRCWGCDRGGPLAGLRGASQGPAMPNSGITMCPSTGPTGAGTYLCSLTFSQMQRLHIEICTLGRFGSFEEIFFNLFALTV